MIEQPRLRSRTGLLVATLVAGIVQIVLQPLPGPIALVILIAGPFLAIRFRSAAAAPPLSEREFESGAAAALLNFLFVVAAIAFLEWRDPYYFTQDDNFSMGPVVTASLRSLMSGTFPTWNPFQFLGQPTSVQSIYGLTYPIGWLCFALVHAIGRDHLYLELFVILHILGGYWATYAAARVLKVRPVFAGMASIAFVMSGAALMIARSYGTMAPLFVWMPLLVIAAERLREGRANLRWAILTALAVGLFCHSGNGQMWVYGVLFFAIAVAIYLRRESFAYVTVAALFSIAISLLLIVPQMTFMRVVTRTQLAGTGVYHALLAMFLPKPLVHASHPDGWGNAEHMAAFFYAGTLPTLITVIAIVVVVAIAIWCRRVPGLVRENVWLLCAAVALWGALGNEAGLWRWISHVPVFDKFAGAWKLLVYFNLFAALASALILERFLTRRRVDVAIAVAVAALLFWNVVQTRSAFYDFADDPYPPLPSQLVKSGGRILPIAPDRDLQPGYTQTLMLDFPSAYGVVAFDGYDPFVRNSEAFARASTNMNRDPVGAARAYGIRWLVLYEPTARWNGPRFFTVRPFEGFRREVATHVLPLATKRFSNGLISIYELPGSDPLAFSGRTALPLTLAPNGVTVDVRGASDVVINFLRIPWMVATVDGRPVELAQDQWGRMTTRVPAGGRTLRVRYEPPWRTAAIASACVLLAGIAIAALAKR